MNKQNIKQNKDIKIAEYFTPCKITISDSDRIKFLEWSSLGLHKEDIKLSHFNDGFNALIQGKKRAGLTMRLWEDAVLEGSIPYYTLLIESDLPEFVIYFMKKEMFKGEDKNLIEKLYTSVH